MWALPRPFVFEVGGRSVLIPRRGRDAYDYAAKEALDFDLDLDPADPVPTAGDSPAAFAERGVLAWRDTFESV